MPQRPWKVALVHKGRDGCTEGLVENKSICITFQYFCQCSVVVGRCKLGRVTLAVGVLFFTETLCLKLLSLARRFVCFWQAVDRFLGEREHGDWPLFNFQKQER